MIERDSHDVEDAHAGRKVGKNGADRQRRSREL